ncbi:hypothetical protein RHSIM_Rhsim08G0184400 [Rhododendron simsii]|uniref:Nudix hydrolase domain-containing protein n=1 Tax=Rhododendron simsii TaxID=118357 RepID=A0A834GMK3_RHOSS|nr:hypothetical protein RHSIM_Rhsim08G0184400 [Rhododendron simsii]
MALRHPLQSFAFLLASSKAKKLGFSFAPILQLNSRRSLRRTICTAMSTESSSSQLTHTITVPSRPAEPVHIVAAPGVNSSDFRRVSLPLSLSLATLVVLTPPVEVEDNRVVNGETLQHLSYTFGWVNCTSYCRNAIESSLFKQWLKNTEMGILANGAMSLTQVLIQGVDMFGKHVGFLKFKADVIDKETGKKVPGIVFARGPAVAVLILLESEGETFVVLTEQVRVPVGRLVLELPAGMLDDDKGDFVGTAVREVEEEIGIRLNPKDMVDLTSFLDPSTGCRVFPSPGGCDEEISVFLYRGHVDKEVIVQLQGKETGLRERGELIVVHVVDYENLWRVTADAKTLVAIALYEMAKKRGLLPPR